VSHELSVLMALTGYGGEVNLLTVSALGVTH